MRGSRKFCQGGGVSMFDGVFLLIFVCLFFVLVFFFLVDEGREDLNTTIRGPSSARERNAI